jgi:hypothetical protein
MGADIVVVEVEAKQKHVGLYFRQRTPNTPDQLFRLTPRLLAASRALLLAFPAADDLDICQDAPWAPHPDPDTFVTAAQVQVFRDRLDRTPAAAVSTRDVLALALRDKAIGLVLDKRILRESPAYADALRNTSLR